MVSSPMSTLTLSGPACTGTCLPLGAAATVARALSLRTQTSTPGLSSAAVAGRPGGASGCGACAWTSRAAASSCRLASCTLAGVTLPACRRSPVAVRSRPAQRLHRFVVGASPRRLEPLLGLGRARLGFGALALGLGALGLGGGALGGDALALDLEVEQQLLEAGLARAGQLGGARADGVV